MKLKKVLLILLVAAVLICGCIQAPVKKQPAEIAQPLNKTTLVIFHAGSLTIPLQDLNNKFKEYMRAKGYDVEIKTEASGSVMAVVRPEDVTLSKKAEILGLQLKVLNFSNFLPALF